LIIEGACQTGTFYLTLTSFSQSTDFVKYTSSFYDKVSFSISIQSRLTIFDPHIDDGGCMSARNMSPNLSLIFTIY